ncbi:MAG TPA: hypothetical protein VJL81_05670 [Solirubrobacterales bacterium]|nr:hypothetical protein [Solirubrobacterales bacterium]
MKRSVPTILAVTLLVAACGGGSSGGSSSTVPKQATAPNAPAGSKVTSCKEDGLEAEQLRATAVSCDVARTTMTEWENDPVCARGGSSARSSCSIGAFRCQAVKVEAGASVSCAGPQGDVSFILKSGD